MDFEVSMLIRIYGTLISVLLFFGKVVGIVDLDWFGVFFPGTIGYLQYSFLEGMFETFYWRFGRLFYWIRFLGFVYLYYLIWAWSYGVFSVNVIQFFIGFLSLVPFTLVDLVVIFRELNDESMN